MGEHDQMIAHLHTYIYFQCLGQPAVLCPAFPPTRFLFGRVFRQSSQGPEYPAAGSQLDYFGLKKDLGNP